MLQVSALLFLHLRIRLLLLLHPAPNFLLLTAQWYLKIVLLSKGKKKKKKKERTIIPRRSLRNIGFQTQKFRNGQLHT